MKQWKHPLTSGFAYHRSQDSLSLMHHANAAGSQTPAMIKSPVMIKPVSNLPTPSRQPLANMDLNKHLPSLNIQSPSQPPAQHADAAVQKLVSVVGSMATKQQQQWGKVLEKQSQEAVIAPDKQTCITSTAQQAKGQLRQQQGNGQLEDSLQGYEQTSGVPQQLYAGAGEVLAHFQSSRRVANAHDHAGAFADSQSPEAEEAQLLAEMLEPAATSAAERQQPAQPAAAKPGWTSQHASPAPSYAWHTPYLSPQQLGSHTIYSVANPGAEASQQVLSPSALISEPECAAHNVMHSQHLTAGQQTAWQPHEVITTPLDAGNATVQSFRQQQRPAWTLGDAADLPIGVPLTPLPTMQAQPRDSLEASIWKLSSSQKQQVSPWTGSDHPARSHGERSNGIYGFWQCQQQPDMRDKPLRKVRDSLEAALHKLATKQDQSQYC